MPITLKSLPKHALEEFLQKIARNYSVFVPSRRNGFVSYSEFARNNFLKHNYSNFDIPPAKGFFFPPIMKKYIDYPFEDSWMKPTKKALYGVRPCDAKSLVLLDKAIKDNDSYKGKREDTLIIVEGCNTPLKTCFCTSVKGGPFSNSGADIFMTDIGDCYVVEDISGRGADYLHYISDAGRNHLVRKEQIAVKSLSMIEEHINFEGISGKLELVDKLFEANDTWRRLGECCTNCTRCTSVCPTCHCCFVVEDVIEIVCDHYGKVAKDFDPCMLNICLSDGLAGEIPKGYKRLQRRLMDKFCRTNKIVGQPFCVGCGRCITNCAENIDITEILKVVLNMGNKTSGDIVVNNGVHR